MRDETVAKSYGDVSKGNVEVGSSGDFGAGDGSSKVRSVQIRTNSVQLGLLKANSDLTSQQGKESEHDQKNQALHEIHQLNGTGRLVSKLCAFLLL